MAVRPQAMLLFEVIVCLQSDTHLLTILITLIVFIISFSVFLSCFEGWQTFCLTVLI